MHLLKWWATLTQTISWGRILAMASCPLLFVAPPASACSEEAERQLRLFQNVYEKLLTEYVEKPNGSQLIEAAIKGMVTSLDGQSSYLSRKAFRDLEMSVHGPYGNPGIIATMKSGVFKIIAPMDDSPAARAGLLANDVITHIDDDTVGGLTLEQAMGKIRGEPYTAVRLRIRREDLVDPIDVTLQRERIKLAPMRSRIESGEVVYIRMTFFDETTVHQLKKTIEKVRAEIVDEAPKGFVIDLRNHTGGILDYAALVADAFLDDGEIVSIRGRGPDTAQTLSAKSGDLAEGKPIVVLVNGGTAGEAEMVAGALQDHRRATLIGTRTFGNGAVRSIVPLDNEGALRLITGYRHTPSGRSIEARGIEPDLEVLQDRPDTPLRDGSADARGSSSYGPADPAKDRQIIAAVDFLRAIRPKAADTATRSVPN